MRAYIAMCVYVCVCFVCVRVAHVRACVCALLMCVRVCACMHVYVHMCLGVCAYMYNPQI